MSSTDSEMDSVTFREASFEDIAMIESLAMTETFEIFGPVNVEALLFASSSMYSFVLEDHSPNKVIIGFLNIASCPNINSLPVEGWLEWLQSHYSISSDVFYDNIFFIDYLTFDIRRDPDLFRQIIVELFLREPKLQFICTIIPPQGVSPENCSRFFSFGNSPEDNDDLVAIVDNDYPEIKKELGDFYIAEAILDKDPTNDIIVAEILSSTVAMMWVSTNVDIAHLNKNFQLAHCGNLTKNFQVDCANEDFEWVKQACGRMSGEINKILIRSYAHSLEFQEICEKRMFRFRYNPACYCKPHEPEPTFQQNYKQVLFQMWEALDDEINYCTRHTKDNISKRFENENAFTPQSDADVFAIKLFGYKRSLDKRRVIELLAAIFGTFPDKNYCVLSVPAATDATDLHFLIKYFTHVVTRPGSKVTYDLYITHRTCIMGDISLNQLRIDDVPDLRKLLACNDRDSNDSVKEIEKIINDVLVNPGSQWHFLIARCMDILIGFVITKPISDMDQLRTEYHLWQLNFNPDNQLLNHHLPDYDSCEIFYLKLHPLFVREASTFFRWTSHITNYRSFYYKLIFNYQQQNLPNSLIGKMFPMAPRWRTVPQTQESQKPDKEQVSLHYYNVKQFSSQSVKENENNTKLVIIGFDTTCKSFLRSLLYSLSLRYPKVVKFNNVTVILKYGVLDAEYNSQQNMCYSGDSCWLRTESGLFSVMYMRKLELRVWVKFVPGVVTKIYRRTKVIIVDDSVHIPYDVLFLMCSNNFGCPKEPQPQYPLNYIEVNNKLDRLLLYTKLKILLSLPKSYQDFRILLYGDNVKAHTCINFMVEHNVTPNMIHLVIPDTSFVEPHCRTAFDDEYIENVEMDKLEELGIAVHRNYNFVDWHLDENDKIDSVQFEMDVELITLKCGMFISYHERALDYAMTKVLQEAEIILYSGQIVIDKSCKTNDPSIYALGKCTTFMDDMVPDHRYFSQIEVGAVYAKNFTKHLKITAQQIEFKEAIFVQGILPGSLTYVNLRAPGWNISQPSRRQLHNHGSDLVTFPTAKADYCRVHLNESGFVEAISCFSSTYRQMEYLAEFYNRHESLLYNLRSRFEKHVIQNLLDFFHEPWVTVILHEHFMYLQSFNRQKMLECIGEFHHNALYFVPDQNERAAYLKNRMKQIKMNRIVEENFIQFLRLNRSEVEIECALPEDF